MARIEGVTYLQGHHKLLQLPNLPLPLLQHAQPPHHLQITP